MARPTLHDPETLLDTARDLALADGLPAVTVDAVSAISGAPSGSIYHRFRSRDELVARTWMRAAQRSQRAMFAALAGEDDAGQAAVAAALAIVRFARTHPGDARLLAAYGRRDLMRGASPGLAAELAGLNRDAERALARLTRSLTGSRSPRQAERVALAVLDLPLGAMRRALSDGRPLPATLEIDVERAVRAVLEGLAG